MNTFFGVFILSIFTLLALTAFLGLFAKRLSNFEDALEIVQLFSPLIALVAASVFTIIVYL